MLNVGQTSLKTFSENDILLKAKKIFDKEQLFDKFRVGSNPTTDEIELILPAYISYYQQYKEEFKHKHRKCCKDKCKPCDSYEKHVECHTKNCNENESDW